MVIIFFYNLRSYLLQESPVSFSFFFFLIRGFRQSLVNNVWESPVITFQPRVAHATKLCQISVRISFKQTYYQTNFQNEGKQKYFSMFQMLLWNIIRRLPHLNLPIADSCTFSCYDGVKRIPEQKEKDIYHEIKNKI